MCKNIFKILAALKLYLNFKQIDLNSKSFFKIKIFSYTYAKLNSWKISLCFFN